MKHLGWAFLWLLLSTAASYADDDSSWSSPVAGMRARISVLPPEAGDCFCRVYLELQNTAHVMGLRKVAFSPRCLSLQVTDQNGRPLSVSTNEYDGMSQIWEPLLMPYDSQLRFQIGSHGLGIPPNTWRVIDMGAMNSWIIPKDDTAHYLSGTLSLPRHPGDASFWNGLLLLPKVQIPKD